jgi:hypothetical protein
MSKPWLIYVLIDPRDGRVRYVGWTINLRQRLRDHMKPSRLSGNQRRDRWLASLIADGFYPRVETVEHGDGQGHAEAECKWITHYRSLGFELTNLTDGGEGTQGRRHTAVAKQRMSEKRRGRKPSPQALAAARVATLGKPRDPKIVAAMRAKLIGRPKAEIHRQRLAASKRGKALSDEHKKKLVDAHQNRDPEERLRLARHAQGFRGPWSKAARHKLSEAKKAWWASRSSAERSEIMRRNRAKNGAADRGPTTSDGGN